MKYQFDKIDKKEITITDLDKSLNCSRTWLSILIRPKEMILSKN